MIYFIYSLTDLTNITHFDNDNIYFYINFKFKILNRFNIYDLISSSAIKIFPTFLTDKRYINFFNKKNIYSQKYTMMLNISRCIYKSFKHVLCLCANLFSCNI